MAIAGVAVEMGPRNRRRLATGAVVIGTLAAVVGGLLLFGPGTHSTSRSGSSALTVQLSFGMTRQQVEHLTGAPTKTVGNCLFFRPKDGRVGSVSVTPNGVIPDPRFTGDLRLCFVSGVYSEGSWHIYSKLKHGWIWSGWPLVIDPPPAASG